MVEYSQQLLLGLDECELVESPLLSCRVHSQVLEPLHFLAQRAASAGFVFKVASSYRSFERQLLIWNNKARGLRPVLNDAGEVIDLNRLSEREKVFAILRWSALPGASRHHWGTDIDVYGAAQLNPDYQLQLTVAETQGAGPFAEFHCWLSDELAQGNSDFFRPYVQDRGGIAPEPWHLSYAPLAMSFSGQLTPEILRAQLAQTELELKQTVLDNLDEIYQRFICVA
ncbi:M15 family metallopeptidase [Cellvibrio sp. OA-2007]|uniref:M15 family metallopeptidase n=1 Tax=Cellvibrio sp. OA-2007 TaxID=529823 RepID=UPI0007859D92|nr:M15 family metallopeptidase [Cellvibrio sp. OA-2007]